MTIYIVDSHWRHRNYEWKHMELCSKQKSVKITQNIFYMLDSSKYVYMLDSSKWKDNRI